MGHSVITCDFCKSMVMEGRNTWECDCGAKYKEGVDGKWSWVMGEQKTAKVVNLFNKKEDKQVLSYEKLNDHDIQKFLDVLDESLETFMTMSPHEKYNLYASLVSFTHTSLGIFMKGEKV